MDPLAKKLTNAVDRAKEQKAAEEGERLLAEDFARKASKDAPVEFQKLGDLLRKRVEPINAHGRKEIQELRYVPGTPRVDAGKYALVVHRRELLDAFELDVTVGIHPNAAQFMDEVPETPTTCWHYRAATDENGFFWLSGETGAHLAFRVTRDLHLDLSQVFGLQTEPQRAGFAVRQSFARCENGVDDLPGDETRARRPCRAGV